MFDFNASLIDNLPVSLILFPVDYDENRIDCFVNGFHLCVISWSSLAKQSSVSVVFVFNALLIITAPVSPMLLSVVLRKKKREDCWWIPFACVIPLVFTNQIEFSERCVSFQCITQWRCSNVSNVVPCWFDEMKRSGLLIVFMSAFVFMLTAHTECSECCVCFQCITQICCSCVSQIVYC